MRSVVSRLKKRLYFVAAGYFRAWANLSLRRWRPRVIAVTGSVGKTTLLHLLEIQLDNKAHYSHRANSSFGVAFDIVGLSGVYGSKLRWLWLLVAVPVRSVLFTRRGEFYVVELDAERPKEAEFMARWLRPEVTLWVSVGRSHAEWYDAQVARGQYDTVEAAIVHEFAWLAKLTRHLVVIDGDNEPMQQAVQGIAAKVVPVSQSGVKTYEVTPERTQFTMASGQFVFNYPMPRETYVQLGMCEALMHYLGLPLQHDLSRFAMPPGRSSFFAGKKGLKLIDSSYNAHLMSMRSVLGMFAAIKVPHKWLVIGDLTEQGAGEAEEHRRLGTLLASIPVEQYILIGRRTKRFTEPVLIEAGLTKKTLAFERTLDAMNYIEASVKGRETILFKGSQYLEAVVERLLADPADAAKLCRREPVYERRRKRWGLA